MNTQENNNGTENENKINTNGNIECRKGGKGNGASRLETIRPWLEPVDGARLLEDLGNEIKGYVVLPKWIVETLSLWILHTYAFHLRDTTTYIGVESPEKRCGKTTLLNVLAKLANRAVVASNISSPAFFRVIEELQPTLMIDEADTFLPSNDELRGILNAGNKRDSAYVWRVAHGGCYDGANVKGGEKISRLVKFSCWCPKLVATIGRLPETLADRCIMVRMQRKLVDEECRKLRELEPDNLKRRCARFVLDHAQAIAKATPSIPKELNDRAGDNWEPILVLADLAGGEWPQKARQAALAISGASQDRSVIGSLLLDMFLGFKANQTDRMFTRDLLKWLNSLEGRPWREALNGKQLTDMALGRQLKRYGVQSKTVWIGEQSAKGYALADFQDVYRRYVPWTEIEALYRELNEGRKPGEERAERENVES